MAHLSKVSELNYWKYHVSDWNNKELRTKPNQRMIDLRSSDNKIMGFFDTLYKQVKLHWVQMCALLSPPQARKIIILDAFYFRNSYKNI